MTTLEVVDLVQSRLPVSGSDGFDVGIARSPDPDVVFSSLAQHCAAGFVDELRIELTTLDGEGTPSGMPRFVGQAGVEGTVTTGGLARVADRAAASDTHTVVVAFAHEPSAQAVADHVVPPRWAGAAFRGRATFVWYRHAPTDSERAHAELLVAHAVQSIAWQRNSLGLADALAKTEHLSVALKSSRQIGQAVGILMSLHKITSDAAFELLTTESQRRNRKVRDLAVEVADTGWLEDPAPRERHAVPTGEAANPAVASSHVPRTERPE